MPASDTRPAGNSRFTLFPAIDLKDGACVRLLRGEMSEATVFSRDPAAQAQAFGDMGFTHLHVVDLNGAFAGTPVNHEAVRQILSVTRLPVQLGGGIRSRGQIDAWLKAGIQRVILGTAALHDPDLVRQSARDLPGRVLVGIDARDGKVAVQGWAETSQASARELAQRFEDCGVAGLIVTDIGRDGLKSGVNVGFTTEIAQAVSIPVIASGGMRDIEDIRQLKEARVPIAGAILGRALYDGDIDPTAALDIAAYTQSAGGGA